MILAVCSWVRVKTAGAERKKNVLSDVDSLNIFVVVVVIETSHVWGGD